MADLRAKVEGLDFLWDTQCVCDYRQEQPEGSFGNTAPDALVRPDCANCDHPLTEHPNGWTCTATVRKPKNPKRLLEQVLDLIPEGAVLMTEETLADEMHTEVYGGVIRRDHPAVLHGENVDCECETWAASILARIREVQR